MSQTVVYDDVSLYGAVGRLYDMILSGNCPDEVLVSGSAGTGKSMGITNLLVLLCEEYPGIRVLIGRKTRASMSQSILVTLENHAFPKGHPAIASGGQRTHRTSYRFPNGSEIVVAGFDDPERIKSTEYDIVFVNEATELTVTDWEIATSRLRHGKLPLGQIAIADCNPDAPTHWLYKRCTDGRMKLMVSLHKDNPAMTEKYLTKLKNLTGVRRKRLYEGLWVSAEGAIWENFDLSVHVIKELPANGLRRDADGNVEWRMVVAGVDWGFTHPGSILIAGVDNDGRIYIQREVHRRAINVVAENPTDDSWVKWAKQLQVDYKVESWQCDHSEPGHIMSFRRAGISATEADKDVTKGLDAVRDRFAVQGDGRPRIFIMQDALRERCPLNDDDERPCGLIEEIGGYTFKRNKQTDVLTEEPNKIDDDSCDALRYLTIYVDRFFTPAPKAKKPVRRTAGYILGHPPEHYEDSN